MHLMFYRRNEKNFVRGGTDEDKQRFQEKLVYYIVYFCFLINMYIHFDNNFNIFKDL